MGGDIDDMLRHEFAILNTPGRVLYGIARSYSTQGAAPLGNVNVKQGRVGVADPLDEVGELLRKRQEAIEEKLATTRREIFLVERMREIENKLSDLDEWVMKLSEHIAHLARIELAQQGAERREKRWREARRKPIRSEKKSF